MLRKTQKSRTDAEKRTGRKANMVNIAVMGYGTVDPESLKYYRPIRNESTREPGMRSM